MRCSGVVLAMVIGAWIDDARAQDTGAAVSPGYVYRMVRVFDDSGAQISATEYGSGLVTLADGTTSIVNERTLVDADGTTYAIEATAIINDDGLLESSVTLAPLNAIVLTDAELEEVFLASHDATELEAFRQLRATARVPSTGPFVPSIDPRVAEWRSEASSNEFVDAFMVMRANPALVLPQPSTSLLGSDPIADLLAQEERLLAIEDRKTEIDALQAPVLQTLTQAGGQVLEGRRTFQESRSVIERILRLRKVREELERGAGR